MSAARVVLLLKCKDEYGDEDVKSKVRVSLISSCYRGELHLPRFFECLLSQSIADRIELVLAHNEPSDRELAQVRAFERQHSGRVKHLIIPTRENYSSSWNRCMEEASADVLAVWNVDDVRTTTSLEEQLSILMEQRGVDFVFGNFRTVNLPGSTEGTLMDVTTAPLDCLSHAPMLLGPFFMFRKSICERAGFCDEQLSVSADYDFAIRLALHGKGARVESELGYFLDTKEGLSTRSDSRVLEEDFIVHVRYGIFDLINYDLIHAVTRYSVPYIKQFGEWIPVADLVPRYQDFIGERFQERFRDGLTRCYWSHGVLSKIPLPTYRIIRSLKRRLKGA